MNFIKVCMECGNEFETEDLYDNTLSCNNCGSGDIYQASEEDYANVTLEYCFTFYHTNKVACICNADNKEVVFMEE